jgi:transcriptional regulator
MYIPEHFKEVRTEEIERIIKDFPLACLVANTPEGLIAAHIPLILKGDEYLIGHLAKSNEMPSLVERDQEVMCIFRGDDAYVSAKDYPQTGGKIKKVPTWNYQVVHIYGTIRFYNDRRSRLAATGFLTKQIERQVHGEEAWRMADAPLDYIMEQIEDITAFDVTITKVLAKSKMNQNDPQEEIESVIDSLEAREEEGMASSMKRWLADAGKSE